jgi:PAS domain S-box-containing protein
MEHQSPNTFENPANAGGIDHAAWWQAAFDGAEEAQLVCDGDGNVVEINRRMRQLFEQNTTTRDAAAIRLDGLIPAETYKVVMEFLQRPEASSRTLSGIGFQIGGRVVCVVDLHLCRLGNRHCHVSFRDVSKRQRLDAHAQRLITAVDSTQDVVYLTDADFRLTFVNAAFQSVTGYNIEESLGRNSEFLRETDERDTVGDYRSQVKQGTGWVGKLVNRRADGTSYQVEAAISPIFDQAGHFTGAAVFERDLTAHVKLGNDLLAERDLVRSVIDSFDSAVYTMDREFRLTQFNDGWRKLPTEQGWLHLGEPPQIGRSLLEFVGDADRRAELREMLRFVLATGQAQELSTTSSNGGHWLTKVIPWRHGAKVHGLICTITDQTRFMTLQNQLFEAQKMEIVGALTAGVAHDFNNLLQAITGNVDLLLLNSALDATLRDRVGRIEKAARRAADLTQQLLSFSRTSEEKAAVTDLNQSIKDVAQLARRTSREKVNIVPEIARVSIEVAIDETRIQQLLLNLCVNALDAMPNGGKLTISNALVPLTEDQAAKIGQETGVKFARCSVSDTGTGILPEIFPRIFDTFFTSKEKGKGTGLGLGIVQNIVKKHGGFVEVESTIGKGTTFHVFIPVVRGATGAASARKEPKLKSGSGRILVVDDQELVLEFSKAFLAAAGYSVQTAVSAADALEWLEKQVVPVDLVLTDYCMPGKDGTELAREIRQRWPHIKLILASGFLERDVRQMIEKEFGARVLDKPYVVEDATRMIAESIGGGGI